MTSNFFLFLNVIPQVSNTSISTNFTSLSACHPFENTKIPSTIPPLTLLLVKTRHTRRDEERFHADDGGKMDRVCCRRGKYE